MRFAVAAMTLTSLLAAGVAFLVNIVSARYLGPEFRGLVATVLQVAYFVSPLIGFGADRALLKDSAAHALPSPGAVISLTAVAAVVIGLVYQPWIALAAPAALVTVWFTWFRADALATGRYLPYLGCFVGYQASILGGTVACWLLDVADWRWWAAVYVFPALALGALGAARAYGRGALPRRSALACWRANWQLQLSALSKLTSMRFNRIVMPLIAGPASLGSYIVIATATEPLYWLAQALADVTTAVSDGRVQWGRALRVLARAAALFSALGLAGGIALYVLVVPVFGEAYRDSLPLVAPLTAAAVLLAAFRLVNGILLAIDEPRAIAVAEGSAALAALVVSVPAIWWGGALGAAWSTILVYVIGLMTGLVMLKKVAQ